MISGVLIDRVGKDDGDEQEQAISDMQKFMQDKVEESFGLLK
jgi:hypothetical protein